MLVDLTPEFKNFAFSLAVIEDTAKKSPTLIPPGKKKGKRFRKILSRKHHNLLHHSNVDGEVPSKLRRSYSEGSTEDYEVDVIEPDDDSGEELFELQTVRSCEETVDDSNGQNVSEDSDKDSMTV